MLQDLDLSPLAECQAMEVLSLADNPIDKSGSSIDFSPLQPQITSGRLKIKW